MYGLEVEADADVLENDWGLGEDDRGDGAIARVSRRSRRSEVLPQPAEPAARSVYVGGCGA